METAYGMPAQCRVGGAAAAATVHSLHFCLQLSLPLVGLSACGWALFVVGFAAINLREN